MAIKVYHLNPKRVDKVFKLMLVRKIWKFSRRIRMMQMKREGGRVGETLDRVGPESLLDSGRPDSRKGRVAKSSPPPMCRGPAKAGVCDSSPGPDPRPQTPGRTDNTTAMS